MASLCIAKRLPASAARSSVSSRRVVVAHGIVDRVASVAVAGWLAASPVYALEAAQGTVSAQYEQEMLQVISSRQGGKELNLEPKVVPAPAVVEVLDTEAPLKVDATMSIEQRKEIIRAAALKETVVKAAPASKWAPSKPAYSASRSSMNASSNGNPGAVVGLLALVAAAGGAAYFYQANNATDAQPTSTTTGTGLAEDTLNALNPTDTREGTPAPSSPM